MTLTTLFNGAGRRKNGVIGTVPWWMVMGLTLVAMTGLTGPTLAQTLEEADAGVAQLSEETAALSQALREIGQESLLILRRSRLARWALVNAPERAVAAIEAAAQESEILGEELLSLLAPDQEIAQLIEQPQELSSVIEALIDDGLIDGERGDLIQRKLLDLSDLAVALEQDLKSLQSQSSEVQGAIDEARAAATAEPADFSVTNTALGNCVRLLLKFGRDRRLIVLAKKAAIAKIVAEIKELLRPTEPVPARATSRQPSEFVAMGREVAAMQVKVYAPDGRLLLTHNASGQRVRLAELVAGGRALANGVYLCLVSGLGADGRALRTELMKLVVQR